MLKEQTDRTHGPPGQISRTDTVTVGWPNQSTGSETSRQILAKEEMIVCVCASLCVCPVSVVGTELHTHTWAPEGERFGLVWLLWECLWECTYTL